MRRSEEARIHDRLERFQAGAKGAGVKLTHQRLEIFKELAQSEVHPDAETVFRAVQARVPTVSLDTVYRTLWMLHDLGLVSILGPKGDGVRFDVNVEPHHHYVCVSCGLVRDFESDLLEGMRLPEAVKRLGSVIGAHVEVRGLCATCRQAPPNAPTRTASRDKPTVKKEK